jgi:hypothetical protein
MGVTHKTDKLDAKWLAILPAQRHRGVEHLLPTCIPLCPVKSRTDTEAIVTRNSNQTRSAKIIAHPPILVERASCPQRPRDSNYCGKADHASEDDQHDVEIIAWNLRRPTRDGPIGIDFELRLQSGTCCRNRLLVAYLRFDRE